MLSPMLQTVWMRAHKRSWKRAQCAHTAGGYRAHDDVYNHSPKPGMPRKAVAAVGGSTSGVHSHASFHKQVPVCASAGVAMGR